MEKGQYKICQNRWKATKMSHAWRGSIRNARWGTLSTYVLALRANKGMAHGSWRMLSICIRDLEGWKGRDVKWGLFPWAIPQLALKVCAYVESIST